MPALKAVWLLLYVTIHFQKLWAKWSSSSGKVSLRDFYIRFWLTFLFYQAEMHFTFLGCLFWKGTSAILMRTSLHCLTLWQPHCSFIIRNRCLTHTPIRNRCREKKLFPPTSAFFTFIHISFSMKQILSPLFCWPATQDRVEESGSVTSHVCCPENTWM